MKTEPLSLDQQLLLSMKPRYNWYGEKGTGWISTGRKRLDKNCKQETDEDLRRLGTGD